MTRLSAPAEVPQLETRVSPPDSLSTSVPRQWRLAVLFAVSIPTLYNRTDWPPLENWATIFLALSLQALPFLVLGVIVSAMLSAFVTPRALAKVVPKGLVASVGTAAIAATALPGCECSSVPVANRLLSRGVRPAAALTFLLAAPAINPVVVVATTVAFPGRPEMALARFGASILAAVVVGLIWGVMFESIPIRTSHHEHEGSGMQRFSSAAVHDFVQAGGYLIVGASIVATIQTVVPPRTLASLGGSGLLAIAIMAVAAVVLSMCSEGDAFVAAGLSQFSLTSRLVFLVVGPMIDIKLVAMQTGAFGKSFVARFAPLTFVVALASSLVVAWIIL